jgi:hypothetical protein
MPTKVEKKPTTEGMVPVWPGDAEEGHFEEVAITATREVENGGTEEPGTPWAESALVPVEAPPTHHLVVGMATLASMPEDEFKAKLEVMRTGQDRIRILMEQLLVKGEDYGTVKGIDRPFLHQPGAEKLSNFYGFAVEQEAEKLVGDGITSPPLAYHVKSYVHLGDFSGPTIAMGYGEASSWEEKYRYRWAKATCPKCGREGLIKGKADGKLKGKWWCPQKEGGCNSTFEAADPQVAPPQKIDNPDPHSMAETLIQMAGKRSFVASIRRATGTSGLFTQDEDSPNVQRQVADISNPYGDPEPEPTITAGPTGEVGVGAKTEAPSIEQLQRLPALAKEKGIKKEALAELFERLFKMTVPAESPAITAAARSLTAVQLGQLLLTMDTGELPQVALAMNEESK